MRRKTPFLLTVSSVLFLFAIVVVSVLFYEKRETEESENIGNVQKPIVIGNLEISEKESLKSNENEDEEEISEEQKIFENNSRKMTTVHNFQNDVKLAAEVARRCLEAGGKINLPKDNKAGGGPICSLSEISDEKWKPAPQIKDINLYLEYKVISDTMISGGTAEGDLIICQLENQKCEVK